MKKFNANEKFVLKSAAQCVVIYGATIVTINLLGRICK